MCGSVIAGNAGALRSVDAHAGAVLNARVAGNNAASVDDESAHRSLRPLNANVPRVVRTMDCATITNLSAGFHIERRARENDLNLGARASGRNLLPVDEHSCECFGCFECAMRVVLHAAFGQQRCCLQLR